MKSDLYERAKKYVPLSIGPIALCFLIEFAQFMLTAVKLACVGFLFFEVSMLIIGIYCGVMRSISEHFKYDVSKLNICKATPMFNWGVALGQWAITEGEAHKT